MVRLYMDVHVPDAITQGLRARGVDVRTSQEDSTRRLPDPELLDRATALGRVLFTQDDDLITEAARRQNAGKAFAGVLYVHQQKSHQFSYGTWIAELEIVALAGKTTDFENRVQYLPL